MPFGFAPRHSVALVLSSFALLLGSEPASAFIVAPANRLMTGSRSSATFGSCLQVAASDETAMDLSIPYDAAAKLAYEASDKSMSYDAFKADYEAKAVAEVMAKNTKGSAPAAAVSTPPPSAPAAPVSASSTAEEKGGALVAINEETIEFTAGLAGGVAGLVLGGPVLALIAAAAANYVSRTASAKDSGEAGVIVNAVSTKSIEIYNWLAQKDAQYEVLSKTKDTLEDALGKLKKVDSVNPETVEKVEDALKKTTATIVKVNEEYDLVGTGKLALGLVGELVEKTITRVSDLNEENQLTDKALKALNKAVVEAKETASKAAKSQA